MLEYVQKIWLAMQGGIPQVVILELFIIEPAGEPQYASTFTNLFVEKSQFV